jgi:hypothetical protein
VFVGSPLLAVLADEHAWGAVAELLFREHEAWHTPAEVAARLSGPNPTDWDGEPLLRAPGLTEEACRAALGWLAEPGGMLERWHEPHREAYRVRPDYAQAHRLGACQGDGCV